MNRCKWCSGRLGCSSRRGRGLDRRSRLGGFGGLGLLGGFGSLGGLDLGIFGSLAIFLGAALFFLAGGKARGILTAARIFQRGHAGFLGLAQQLGLQFLTRHQALRRRLAHGGGLRRALLRRRRGGTGCGRRCGRGRRRISLGRSSGRSAGAFTRLAHGDAAPLHLNHDRVLAAMAELLLHLTGLDRALDPQRLAAQNRLVFVAVTHRLCLTLHIIISRRSRRRIIPCSLMRLRIGGVLLPMHRRPGSASQIAFQAAQSRTQAHCRPRVGHRDMDDIVAPHCHR